MLLWHIISLLPDKLSMSPFFYAISPSLSSGDNLDTFLSILLTSFHLIGTSLPSFRDGLMHRLAAFLSRYLPLKIPAYIAELKKLLCAHKLASFHLFVMIVLRKKDDAFTCIPCLELVILRVFIFERNVCIGILGCQND